MESRTKTAVRAAVATLSLAALTLFSPPCGLFEPPTARAQELPAPNHADGSSESKYVGMTRCAACHYTQFKDWKTTRHGKADEILPSKYRKDQSCLECHSTGFGQPASSEEAVASNLHGVSCEACHGPGGAHVRYALTFVGQGRELTDKALDTLRSKIVRTSFETCIKCHTSKTHKPHPDFDRDETTRTGRREADTGSFFQVHRP